MGKHRNVMIEIAEMRRELGIEPKRTKKMNIGFAAPVAKVLDDLCEREGIGPTEALRRLIIWYAGRPEEYDAFYDNMATEQDKSVAEAYAAIEKRHGYKLQTPDPATRQQVASLLAERIERLATRIPERSMAADATEPGTKERA
ncbi:MAG: hypothetical protein M3008_08070 [Chloroflexota bacterium]|nr:hypothetical protein [Chloroflexota bacterium]